MKSFILYGFTDKNLVKIDYRTGKQTHVVYPGQVIITKNNSKNEFVLFPSNLNKQFNFFRVQRLNFLPWQRQ